MATPHVAGAAALVLAQNPTAGPDLIKKQIMDSTDRIDAFKDKMVTGGRLNLAKAVEGFAPAWLSVAPKSGSVRPGQKSDLVFTIDATKLVAGKKQAVVAFTTNDPRVRTLEVPVEVTITGDPKIKLDRDEVAFGEVWIGNEAKQKITITNTGTGRLEITRVNSGRRELSVTPAKLSLAPKEKGSLDLLLTPTSSGRIATTLTIESNAKDEPKVTVTVTAEAKQPPVLEVQPESVAYTLEPDKTGKREIRILNRGEGTLAYSGTIVSTTRDRAKSRSMDQVVQSLNAPGRTPDNYTPGVPMIDDGFGLNENSSAAAVRKIVSNPVSNLEIAILGADRSNYLDNVGKGLIGTKRFSGVTMINVKSVTPTVKELEAFDSVIVYSNYRYHSREKLGENLADYADAGGGVVCMTFETSTRLGNDFVLGGRWLKEKYGVFEATRNDTRDWSSLGEVLLPNHPILKDFESFRGTYRLNKEKLIQGATLLAKWKDGFPLAAFRAEPAAVVGLNFFPASNRALRNGWDEKTDGWKIMANALEWTATGGSPNWLTAAPLEGSVSGGNQKEMSLSFNSAKLSEGNYTAEIRLESNDPKKPYLPVKVTLIVQENQAPKANPIQVNLPEDSSKQFRLSGQDGDGDPITFELLNKPKHGLLRGTPPLLTYEPKANFFGRDSFNFKVSDGRQDSKPATVSIFVSPVDDKPWIKPVDLTLEEDTPAEVPFAYGDPDGDLLQVVITKDPANGFLWKEGKTWTYFPNPHFNGKDSITYKAQDRNGTETPEAKVSIVVKPTNDAPVASNLQVVVKENESVLFELNATDVDGDAIASYDLISPPKHGELKTISLGKWQYRPFKGYNGNDSLTYRASDGKIQGNLATVTFKVDPRNDPPVVEPATFALLEDGKLSIKLIASDPDNDPLTFKVTTGPSHGTLEGSGPEYKYTPRKDFNGTDFFMVVANDGKLDGNATRITLQIKGVNDAPKFESMVGTLAGGYRETPLYLPLRATDVDGDKLDFKLAGNPENGVCRLEGDQLVYFPKIGFTGKDQIEVEVSDGELTDKASFPLNVGEHPNAIAIHLKEGDDSTLGRAFEGLLYELNSRLSRSEDFMLKLEADASSDEVIAGDNEKGLEVTLSGKAPEGEGMNLDKWIETLKQAQPNRNFVFHASAEDENQNWQVTSSLDPTSSVDAEVNDESSSESNSNKDESTGDNQEGAENGTEENGETAGSSDETLQEGEQEETEPGEPTENEETPPYQESYNTLGKMVSKEKIANASSHEGANGWYSIGSLGDFYDAGNGWIYQPSMGWCYAVPLSEDSSWWLYNEKTGWLWFRPDLQHTVFAAGTMANGWIYLNGTSLSETKAFYCYSQQTWQLWE